MKIVVISDIHANLDAFMALPETGDELWVLGDLVDYGPNPKEVVALVRSRAEVVIRGNHDQAVAFGKDSRCSARYRQMATETQEFSIRAIGSDLLGFLQQLPVRRTLERDGKKFYLCHAIPSNPLYEYCPEGSGRWAQEVRETETDYLLVGRSEEHNV